ncbi:hypothetical protein YC2023_025197 [Brassica napus]
MLASLDTIFGQVSVFRISLYRYPDLSLSSTIPPRPTGTGEEGPGSQTETMLNPLWLGLELVMAGTSAEVPLPPDHETRYNFVDQKTIAPLFQVKQNDLVKDSK